MWSRIMVTMGSCPPTWLHSGALPSLARSSGLTHPASSGHHVDPWATSFLSVLEAGLPGKLSVPGPVPAGPGCAGRQGPGVQAGPVREPLVSAAVW